MNQKGFANIVLVLVIVVLAGAVGYFVFMKKPTQPTPILSPTPTPTPTVSPTPTASPINNFEECVRAGYPIGKSLPENWERCWTLPGFQIFIKGLKPTIQQGVYGKITLATGNCMPGTVGINPANSCGEFSIDRKVYILEPVTQNAMRATYLVDELKPIKIGESQNSVYEIALSPGTYSIFVEDNGKKYCNNFRSKGEACQVTIGEKMIKEHNIKIDHASY